MDSDLLKNVEAAFGKEAAGAVAAAFAEGVRIGALAVSRGVDVGTQAMAGGVDVGSKVTVSATIKAATGEPPQ